MNTVALIVLVVVVIIALLLFFALFMTKQHYVKRDITINAPQQKVFDYIRFVQNQENFNKDAKADPGRQKQFKGTDGTVGYVYSWKGNKDAGEGEKEIMNIVEGKSIEMEIRFVKPMHAVARIIMETEALPKDQTKLYWSNSGKLPYPLNILIPVLQKSVARGMDSSLETLKSILEK